MRPSPRAASALTYAVERSFNSISVDGDMSTNDTIVVLANSAAAATTTATTGAYGEAGAAATGLVEIDGVIERGMRRSRRSLRCLLLTLLNRS
jgi:hypothetical protein